MNQWVGTGRITKEIDLRYIAGSGTAVAKFSIACDKGLSKAKKEEWKQNGKPTCDYIRIIVWGAGAEFVANYADKGTLVAVKGSIETGSYEKDGHKVYTTEVKADNYGGVEILEWAKKEEKNDFGMKAKDFEDDFKEIDDGCQIPFE